MSTHNPKEKATMPTRNAKAKATVSTRKAKEKAAMSTRNAKEKAAMSTATAMSTAREIAHLIHDAIDEGTTTVENIHRSIADVPLDVLEPIDSLEEPVKGVRNVQDRSIGAIYGLIRRVNDEVGQLATKVLSDS